MNLPPPLRQILADVGQAAAELDCHVAGYREFVSVYASPRKLVLNVDGRFPYLASAQVVYRLIRFRVALELIDRDLNIGPDELIGLQEISVGTEDDLMKVLDIWKVPPDVLSAPRDCDIPV